MIFVIPNWKFSIALAFHWKWDIYSEILSQVIDNNKQKFRRKKIDCLWTIKSVHWNLLFFIIKLGNIYILSKKLIYIIIMQYTVFLQFKIITSLELMTSEWINSPFSQK